MGGIYKYDVEDLSATASGLSTLLRDFEDASKERSEASGAMGYSDLRGAIEDFVDNWKHNRERQVEAISTAAEALATIRDNYVEGDAKAAAGLRGGGAP